MFTFLSLLEVALLNDDLIETQLHLGTFNHLLFHRLLCDKAEDVDLLLLANTMCAILCLQIDLRVPVAVVEDDNVGRGQVDAKAASSSCEQKHKLKRAFFSFHLNLFSWETYFAGAWTVVVVNLGCARLVVGLAVDAAILVATEVEVIFQQVENTAHLGEEEDTRAVGLELCQEEVQHHHLARGLDQVLVRRVRRAGLNAIKEVRVVAALAQLHDNVEQACLALSLGGEKKQTEQNK